MIDESPKQNEVTQSLRRVNNGPCHEKKSACIPKRRRNVWRKSTRIKTSDVPHLWWRKAPVWLLIPVDQKMFGLLRVKTWRCPRFGAFVTFSAETSAGVAAVVPVGWLKFCLSISRLRCLLRLFLGFICSLNLCGFPADH